MGFRITPLYLSETVCRFFQLVYLDSQEPLDMGNRRLGPISSSPEMMELYCHEKNSEQNLLHYGKPINPQDLSQSSTKLIWWKCPINPEHVWDAPPDRIKRQVKLGFTGCPYCHGKRVDKTNSLEENFPDVAQLWHPSKNGQLLPSDITFGSNKKVWWLCNEGHEWQQGPAILTGQGTRCPYCAGQKLSYERSLEAVAPHLVEEWDEERNGIKASEVMAKTSKDCWWICMMDDSHKWKATPANRVNVGSGCPYCANKKASSTNNLQIMYPEIAAQWHPTKNGEKKPEDYPAGSHKRAWWKCEEGPDHEWSGVIGERTTQEKKSCPFCLGRKVSITNSLQSLYSELAEEWHPTKNGDLTPSEVTSGTHRKVWWRCSEGPDHEWKTSVDARARGGTNCPYCAGQKLSITNSLATTRPKIALEWHPEKNGKLTPHDVMRGSDRKVWWRCSVNPEHEWKARIANRGSHGSGCQFCLKKNQSLLFEYVKSIFPESEIYYDFKHHDLRYSESNYPMELDIWLPNENLAFEYQGEQHYMDVSEMKGWDLSSGLHELRSRDQEKREACQKAGIVLIEIPYTWDKTVEFVKNLLNEQKNTEGTPLY